MLIAQQVRRINELEHQVDELSHRVRQLSSECDGGVGSVKASSDVGRDLTDACGGIGA